MKMESVLELIVLGTLASVTWVWLDGLFVVGEVEEYQPMNAAGVSSLVEGWETNALDPEANENERSKRLTQTVSSYSKEVAV